MTTFEQRCPECGHVLSTGEHSDDCRTARNPERLRELRSERVFTADAWYEPNGGVVSRETFLTAIPIKEVRPFQRITFGDHTGRYRVLRIRWDTADLLGNSVVVHALWRRPRTVSSLTLVWEA